MKYVSPLSCVVFSGVYDQHQIAKFNDVKQGIGAAFITAK
jgi:hypothetical protein